MKTYNIKKFISIIKSHYPNLNIGFSYDDEEDYYHIWHTDSKLQFECQEFRNFVGQTIQEQLYKNDVFNFSFGYDYFEEQRKRKRRN